MPDIQPKEAAAPKKETVTFPKSAQMAMREKQDALQKFLMELADAVAEEKGLKPEDGWQFDPRSLSFTREVAAK